MLYKEHHLQEAQCQWLALHGYAYAGDMNAEKRGPRAAAMAKRTGIMAGEPDLRVYLDNGRTLLIENKVHGRPTSKAQKERHALLLGLGHRVWIIAAKTPQDSVDQLSYILAGIPHTPPVKPVIDWAALNR